MSTRDGRSDSQLYVIQFAYPLSILIQFAVVVSAGLYDLKEKANILHRDISVGNIMIHPHTREGFLIDWDLARFVWELGKGAVEPDRSVCILSYS